MPLVDRILLIMMSLILLHMDDVVETVNDNGTICLRDGIVLQTYNIRNIKPYQS